MSINFGAVKLPFTSADLLTAGVGLLGVVGGFVLLALAFKVVPKLISLIVGSFRGSSKA